MRFARKVLPLLLIGALVVACGDDDDNGTGVTISDFTGSWAATQLLFAPDGGGQAVGLIAVGGQFNLQIESGGSFVADVAIPNAQGGLTEFQLPGTLILDSESSLTVDFTQPVPPFDDFSGDFSFAQNKTVLNLTVPDASFDFNQDGTEDPATVEAIFQRQ